MHYVPQPLSFRWDQDFVDRIDSARGDVPRTVWVRRAVERALADAPTHYRADEMSGDPTLTTPDPAPAERPQKRKVAQDLPRPVESPQDASQKPTGQVSGRSEAFC